jgi:hypothetical protein
VGSHDFGKILTICSQFCLPGKIIWSPQCIVSCPAGLPSPLRLHPVILSSTCRRSCYLFSSLRAADRTNAAWHRMDKVPLLRRSLHSMHYALCYRVSTKEYKLTLSHLDPLLLITIPHISTSSIFSVRLGVLCCLIALSAHFPAQSIRSAEIDMKIFGRRRFIFLFIVCRGNAGGG